MKNKGKMNKEIQSERRKLRFTKECGYYIERMIYPYIPGKKRITGDDLQFMAYNYYANVENLSYKQIEKLYY